MHVMAKKSGARRRPKAASSDSGASELARLLVEDPDVGDRVFRDLRLDVADFCAKTFDRGRRKPRGEGKRATNKATQEMRSAIQAFWLYLALDDVTPAQRKALADLGERVLENPESVDIRSFKAEFDEIINQ